MFQTLDVPPEDPILGLIAAFRNDPSPDKVDLGVGVYRDERGVTAVLDTVKAAEQRLVTEQDSKTYLGPTGNERFNEAITAIGMRVRPWATSSMQYPAAVGPRKNPFS